MTSKSSTNIGAKQMLRQLSRVGTQDYMDHMASNLNGSGIQDRASFRYWALMVINAPGFDYCMGVLIVVNMLVMIIEIDRSTLEDDVTSNTPHWTEVFGWLVLLVFVCELLLRLLIFRCLFFKDTWNVFDFVIVITDTVFSVLGLIVGNLFPVSILRVFRLTKLARVSKVLRVFPELRLLLAGLLSALSAIFWGTLLLCFCLLVWSMVAVLFIHPLNKNIDYEGCDRCPRAYSSVMQAMLTFWQQIVTGDSWGQATIPLIEKYPTTAIFFIPVFLSIGMAVMNLILGVVVNVAEQAKDDMRSEEAAEKYLFKLERETHLFELCRQIDTNQTGQLTREEIDAVLDNPGDFQESISALEITHEDFDIAWAIMDADGSGKISYKEFVSNLCKMRSSDTEFMLAYIKCYITEIRNTLLQVMKNQHAEAMTMEHKVEEEIMKIEKEEETILKDEEMILEIEYEQQGIRRASEKTSQPNKESKNQALSELQICPGEKKVPSSSKSAGPSAPEMINFGKLESPSSDASHCLVPKARDDETQAWFKNITDEIGTMRIELKNILFDISRKVAPPELPLPLMQQETMKAASPSLLVVPGKTPSYMSMCCNRPLPTERRLLGVSS